VKKLLATFAIRILHDQIRAAHAHCPMDSATNEPAFPVVGSHNTTNRKPCQTTSAATGWPGLPCSAPGGPLH
jgi:hypothetical protein